jgi:hypothetical protein
MIRASVHPPGRAGPLPWLTAAETIRLGDAQARIERPRDPQNRIHSVLMSHQARTFRLPPAKSRSHSPQPMNKLPSAACETPRAQPGKQGACAAGVAPVPERSGGAAVWPRAFGPPDRSYRADRPARGRTAHPRDPQSPEPVNALSTRDHSFLSLLRPRQESGHQLCGEAALAGRPADFWSMVSVSGVYCRAGMGMSWVCRLSPVSRILPGGGAP